ncbi:DUF6264 family protein [Microbacterium sp. YY-01]|uniref:DUF6264 family protein n=1 Tax=Microbacterium sp. YY-01 TaxID=3421634 RepID=UPI003D174AC7
MSDATPARPQFGEYASVEEQQRRRGSGVQHPDATIQPAQPALPEPTPYERAPYERRGVTPAGPNKAAASTGGASPAAVSPVDRLVTLGLLAYGLVNVIMTVLAYRDFSAVMNDAWRMLGVEGSFTNYGQGRLWSTVASAVLIVGWTLTAYLSVRRLRIPKHAWWVPLVGAVVTTILASLALAVAIMGDPSFQAHLAGLSAAAAG